jgi:hypothetical protein
MNFSRTPLVVTSLISGLAASSVSLASPVGSFEIQKFDFTSLFNQHDRAAQPQQVPWAGSFYPFGQGGIADESEQKPSYSEKYDQAFYAGSKLATDWEKLHHSCEHVDEELKKGCKDWWGHCNAWSAAAIKEPEPRESLQTPNGTFSVGDQKAYLTELWMSSDALFAGATNKSLKTGDWIYDPKSQDSVALSDDEETTNHEAFWDVTPRAFFYILTNYIGVMGTSVVIDRFTGDEVWNQPLAGYRILPIRKEDRLEPVTRNGRTLYPVRLRMKIFWAHDGVRASHVTQGFDIKKTTDDESIRVTWPNYVEYEGRLLKFTLFFSAPVETNEAGTQVVSAGRIVGQGIWNHQESRSSRPDETHPDFIWMPTVLLQGGMGESNPYIRADMVHQLPRNRISQKPVEPASVELTLLFAAGTFQSKTPDELAALLTAVLRREGIQVTIENLKTLPDGKIQLTLKVTAGDQARVNSILAESGYQALSESH